MITVSKALEIIDRETTGSRHEEADLGDCPGRILAERVVADTDMPSFDRSQMDGYAVIAADVNKTPAVLKIVGESAAGRGWRGTLKTGEAIRIMTGAPVPDGADAIQKLEAACEFDGTVEIREPTEKGRYIVNRGSEIKSGTKIFDPGTRINETMIATLAAFGYAKVVVAVRPRVAVIGTGSEIVGVAETPARDQIRNSNSIMLAVFAQKSGAVVQIFEHVKDEVTELKSQISKAAADSDLVVLTGGVSVGKYDHTKTALTELGASIFFDKVSLKPGKPAVFAALGEALIFGLPGNPVSAAVTFHLFARKALLKMQGATETNPKRGYAVLAGQAKSARERDTYLPARLETTPTGNLTAHLLRWSGSSDFVGFARADALIVIPKGTNLVEKDVVEFVYL